MKDRQLSNEMVGSNDAYNDGNSKPLNADSSGRAILRQIPRNTMKFDIFNALAEYGHSSKLSIHDGDAIEGFFANARSKLVDSLASPTFLHGQRTHSMFEALVVTLGGVRLIKQEDSGVVHTEDDPLFVPDFHLVLRDGSRYLIEVKNFNPNGDFRKIFTLRRSYLDGLTRYAALMSCSLMIAIYWVGWNLWTLLPADIFQTKREKLSVNFFQAMKSNHMAILGDRDVATTPPLMLRIDVDHTKERMVKQNGQTEFTIGNIRLFCKDQEIVESTERSIAMYLMLYGKWRESNRAIISNDQLDAIEFMLEPEETTLQGFEFVGSLSSLFSSYYLSTTSDEETVAQIHAGFTPGFLGQLIPDEYEGSALPIWRFKLKPT